MASFPRLQEYSRAQFLAILCVVKIAAGINIDIGSGNGVLANDVNVVWKIET